MKARKTNIYLRLFAVISSRFTSKSCLLTAAILPDKKTGANVAVGRHHVQKSIGSIRYGTESNLKNRANSTMGMKVDGEEQFDMLKKIRCEPNPKSPLTLSLDSGAYVGANP